MLQFQGKCLFNIQFMASIIWLPQRLLQERHLLNFQYSLSDSKPPQICRTLWSILPNLKNDVVRMITILLISNSFCIFFKHLWDSSLST